MFMGILKNYAKFELLIINKIIVIIKYVHD